MASPPRLQVTGLPTVSTEDASATISPARGTEMRNFLQARLQKNRAPPLVHSWDFWHDRQQRAPPSNSSSPPGGNDFAANESEPSDKTYEDRLEILANVDDVRKFWNVFNNFDLTRLQLRDSVHLFHKGVKPVWEDARNARGGSWTFRVPKSHAAEFWKEVCMLGIGEQLQAAVESERTTFRDDICGLSLSVRFNSMLVQIWNRDAEHQDGVEKILQTVMETLSPELRPREGSYYYKKHSEHAGFSASSTPISTSSSPVEVGRRPLPLQGHRGGGDQEMQSLNAVADRNV